MHANTMPGLPACTAWMQGLHKALNNVSYLCQVCVCLHIFAATVKGINLICAVHHQKLKLELTWQAGTTQNYFGSCFQLHLGSTQSATRWGRSRGSHVSPVSGCREMTAGWLWKVYPWARAGWRKQSWKHRTNGVFSHAPSQPHCGQTTVAFSCQINTWIEEGEEPSWKEPQSSQSKEKTHKEQGKNTNSAQL